MNELKGPQKIISNSQGLISVDFIFSLVLSVGLCIVLFSLTFTLSMAEVAQYVAFSTSRAFAAGHKTSGDQKKSATDKFDSLMNSPALKPIFSLVDGTWFKLSSPDIRGGKNILDASGDFSNDYATTRVPALGVRLTFTPNILSLKLPFLGSTSLDGEPFSANVTSFLFREPTSEEECMAQVAKRYEAILDLDPRYRNLPSKPDKYLPLEDNGC